MSGLISRALKIGDAVQTRVAAVAGVVLALAVVHRALGASVRVVGQWSLRRHSA